MWLFTMNILKEYLCYIIYIIRWTIGALVDLYIMYVRVGLVWRGRRWRRPSMERRDLVMQLAPQSPVHSRISGSNIILTLNEAFLDRSLWKGLHTNGAHPSAIVTGVSYGTIGFYTALNLILCGFNVHGVCRTQNSMAQTRRQLAQALKRQMKLHKEWTGRTGHFIDHVCDLSDMVAVSNLCSVLLRDSDIRVVVCGAGPTASEPRLSPQYLEEQFATHHVGHSLLLLRLLEHRLAHSKLPASMMPRWRFIILSSGIVAGANPVFENVFGVHGDEKEFLRTFNRYGGYCDAKMCNLLFAFALSHFIEGDRRLAPFCSVYALDPGPTRKCIVKNPSLPFLSEVAGALCLSSVAASLYVTDLCLNMRFDGVNGHFFRMGEDQTVAFADLHENSAARCGMWVNSPAFCGIPGPAVSLSPIKSKTLWRFTLSYLTSHALLDPKVFR